MRVATQVADSHVYFLSFNPNVSMITSARFASRQQVDASGKETGFLAARTPKAAGRSPEFWGTKGQQAALLEPGHFGEAGLFKDTDCSNNQRNEQQTQRTEG